MFFAEIGFLIWGSMYLSKFKYECIENWYDRLMRHTLITIIVFTSCLILLTILSVLCIYDRAGKSFYKLKLLEFDYRKHPHKVDKTLRQIRHRKTFYYYNKHWMLRFKCLFWFLNENDNETGLSNIAETFSTLFYKYDVVPSDILAGLLLIREKQKQNQTIQQVRNASVL